MNFGETILKLRKAKAWTQGQLASYSGVKRSYISRIEKGDYTGQGINPEYIHRLAQALGVSDDFLKEAAGQLFTSDANQVNAADKNPELQDFFLHLLAKNPSPRAIATLKKIADDLMEENKP